MSYNADNIDTFCVELWKLFDIFGNVPSRVHCCEGTRKGKEDDPLIGPLPGGVVVDGVPASRKAFGLRGVRNIPGRSWLSVRRIGLEIRPTLLRRATTGKDVKGLREDNTRREAVTSLETAHLNRTEISNYVPTRFVLVR